MTSSTVDPNSYSWLTAEDSLVAVAGCVTVVPGAQTDVVATAFGRQGPAVPEPDLIGDFAAFVSGLEAALAVEDNGYQGSRSAVIAAASRASTNKKAASICWNVEGEVTFTCAARGRLVASFELGFVETDDVPRSLRRLASLADHEDANLVSIGAAMVETYTGVGFSRSDLSEPLAWHRLEPPLDLLQTMTAATTRLNYLYFLEGRDSEVRNLVESLGRLDPARQRRFAEWVAGAAAAQSALGSDAQCYLEVVQSFGHDLPATTMDKLVLFVQKVNQLNSASGTALAVSDNAWFPRMSSARVGQVATLGEAIRWACHPDPATAAWETLYAAHLTLSAGRLMGGTEAVADLERATGAFLNDPSMGREYFLAHFHEPVSAETVRTLLARERAEYQVELAEYLEWWGDGFGEYTGPIEPFELP